MKYLYKTERPVTIDIEYSTAFHNEWITISIAGWLVVHEGYAWNGCSPKLSILDWFWLGTPEGIIDYRTGKPITWKASLAHDALIQFSPMSRKKIDKIFYEILKEDGFKLAWVYYAAVCTATWLKKVFKK